MNAQILDITPEEYFKRPGLSQSIACTLVTQSPLHAWQEHPTLGGAVANDGEEDEEATPAMDFGSVVHTLTLGKGKRIAPLPFKDWRTKDAKAARADARAAGLVPIKTKDFERAQAASAQVVAQLAARGIKLDGLSEVALEWYEESSSGPVLCRGMLDHVWLDRGLILDLKITEDAAPPVVERSAENMGYGIQHAAYTRAITALRPDLEGRVSMLFAFGESKPPYAMNLCRPDGAFRELGDRRWRRAVDAWGACLATNQWPAYGQGVNVLSPPPWAMAREGAA